MKYLFIFIILIVPIISDAAVDLLDLHKALKKAHRNPLIYKDSKRFLFNTIDNIELKCPASH
jgi:hypothetical protein